MKCAQPTRAPEKSVQRSALAWPIQVHEVGVALGRVGDTELFCISLTKKKCCHGSIAPAITKIATKDKMVVEGRPTSVACSDLP